MWTVYVLQSNASKRYHVGCSNNLERRLKEHNSGQSTSTQWHRPWSVIHKELFENQRAAYAREKQIKSYKGGSAFKKLIGE